MSLTWSQRRRFTIIGGAAALGIVLLSALVFSVVYETPSCSDQKQNQGETGVDCGGACAKLCAIALDAPRVSFARTLAHPNGRTDVIAYIENRNREAQAKRAAYTIELYDENGLQLLTKAGTIDLPAQSIVPIFEPAIYAGVLNATRVFISFDEDMIWTEPKKEFLVPRILRADFISGEQPRVVAELENDSPHPFYNVRVVATAFDIDGNAIAASQTVVREVPPRGNAEAVFTWTASFGEPFRVEVVPVLPLP
ncbi:hypothetical protein KKD81_03210 [Patescibacteria group bacterium]|nr:hypothetical protein [Patescibacteria group bacterium]